MLEAPLVFKIEFPNEANLCTLLDAIFTQLKVVMVVEFHMPEEAHFALQGVYYIFAVITCLGRDISIPNVPQRCLVSGVCQSLCPCLGLAFSAFSG